MDDQQAGGEDRRDAEGEGGVNATPDFDTTVAETGIDYEAVNVALLAEMAEIRHDFRKVWAEEIDAT